MTSPSPALSKHVASFVAETRFEDIPQAVRHQGKRALLNFFACALAGSSAPAIPMMLATAQAQGAARIVGRPERFDALTAAWVNAASANVLDFDDTLPDTIAHPTAPVAAPLLALADTRSGTPLSGRDLLVATILGIEMQCRIGRALSMRHYRRGWHITSTCGGFGAALACGRVLALDPAQLVAAMGGAIAQAGGMVETLGTMSKSLGVGGAARAGLVSALMANRGMTGPDQPLEGRFGLFNVMGDTVDQGETIRDLGQRWALSDLEFKPYPCGVVLNPVIDACLHLRDSIDGTQAITEIVVAGPALLRERADRPAVKSGNLSQVSAQHAAAVSLHTGRAGPQEFSDAAVAEPTTRALAALVRVLVDESMPLGSASVSITMRDGQASHVVIDALGSAANPMTDRHIEEKLRAQWEGAALPSQPDRLMQLIWGLESVEDAAELTRATT